MSQTICKTCGRECKVIQKMRSGDVLRDASDCCIGDVETIYTYDDTEDVGIKEKIDD